MSKPLVLSTLEKYGGRKDANRVLYRRAKEEYDSLKKSADTLQRTNPSLCKHYKDTSMGITEKTFDVDLVEGYENLYAVLQVEKVSSDIWTTFTFLLKSQKQQTFAGQGKQKQQSSSASKNRQRVSTIQTSNNNHDMRGNSQHHSQNRQSQKTDVTATRQYNQKMLHPGQEKPQKQQQQYTDPSMVVRQDQAVSLKSRQSYHQHVLDPSVNHRDSNIGDQMQRLIDENKKLREDAKIPNHIYENIQRLEKENNDLKLTLMEKREQIDEMTTRLSRYASQQLTQGNPNIADLSDANRPTKIGERFSAVYDDEWSDAYEILKAERKSDEEIVSVLAEIVKECLEFAKSSLKKTTDEIIWQSTNVMVDPYHSDGLNNVNKLPDKGKGNNMIQQRFAKDFIKLHASLSIPNLKKEFVLKHRYKAEKIRNYVEVLVELTWLMVVQDPPMMLQFINPGDKISEKSFKAYQRSGKIAKVCVWPAVFLHENGPIAAKGFALPRT